MPTDALHFKANGVKVQHMDVHNFYGALMQKSTYQGLIQRDSNQLRPFVLTRSFFMGSQKYGAYWTGDNLSIFEELKGCLVMLLQNSLAA